MRLISINIASGSQLKIGSRLTRTGIDKSAVPTAEVGPLGLYGDLVANQKHHGGPDQAVYVYSSEDYGWWAEQLGRELRPGTFGENLTLSAFGPGPVRIGDRYSIGAIEIEVTAPRIPCSTLAAHVDEHAFIERFRAKATKARQAQSRLKMLEKMEPTAAIVDMDVLPIHLPSPEKQLSPPIIAMERASVGYDARVVLSRLNLSLSNDDRIGLLGANGNGKSTFAKLLAGRLSPMGGDIVRASKLEVGFFAQHQVEDLDLSDTPYRAVARLMPEAPEARVRARAAQMGFSGERADTKVEQLSGGEKARLLMGLSTFHGPHLIILDEPTNHLDIDSRAALIEAINDYAGAVVLVSYQSFFDQNLVAPVNKVYAATIKAGAGGPSHRGCALPALPRPDAAPVPPHPAARSGRVPMSMGRPRLVQGPPRTGAAASGGRSGSAPRRPVPPH